MAKYKHGQEVKFKMEMDLGDVIDLGGIDGMNDFADEKWRAMPGTDDFMLTDIGYNVVSSKPMKVSGPSHIGGDLTIEVTAVLEEM
jgi:hypothetical protein